jgi:hypothetical protein
VSFRSIRANSRRRALRIQDGRIHCTDGSIEVVDLAGLIRAPEAALQLLWLAAVLLAAALLLSHWS